MLLCNETGSKYGWVKFLRTRWITHVDLSNVFFLSKTNITLSFENNAILNFTLIPTAGTAVPWGAQKLKYPCPSHALTHTHTTSAQLHTPAETLRLTCVDHSSRMSKCSVDNNISLSTCSLFAFPVGSWASYMYVLVARWQEFLTVPLLWKSLGQKLVGCDLPLTLHV